MQPIGGSTAPAGTLPEMSAIVEPAPAKTSNARRIWLVVCIVGFVVAIGLAAKGASNINDFSDGPTFDAPGPAKLQLDSGRWVLYEASANGLVTFRPSDVTIVGPGERTIDARSITGSMTLTAEGTHYEAAAEFSAPSAGAYTITVKNSDRNEIKVARAITDSIAGVAVWFVPAGIAGILGLVGLILVLVNPWKPKDPNLVPYPPPPAGWQPPPPGIGPPAGWYTDPWDATATRWWDGATWTGHTKPGERSPGLPT